MEAAAPPAQRLHAATAQLIGEPAAAQDRFGIAVSGGPDSLALLAMAADAWPDRVMAATVDHRLRPESADEAQAVSRLCAQIGIAHVILAPPALLTGNIQSAARTARYALLERWREEAGLDWLMTAHHADDQLETMVMRLNRASGVGGMAGIRARQGRVLRPLLGWRRDDLHALVAARGWTAADDPSNRDPRFDRARVRTALAGCELIDALAASRSASALADADAALDWAADRLGALEFDPESEVVTIRCDPDDPIPREIARRLLIRACALLDPALAPRGEAVEQALDALLSRRQAMLGDWLIRPGRAADRRWTITRAPPRRDFAPKA